MIDIADTIAKTNGIRDDDMRAIRQHDLLDGFPGRTEADLYLFLSDHRARLEQEFGWSLEGPQLAEGFRTRFDVQAEAERLRAAVKQTQPDAYLMGENFFDATAQRFGRVDLLFNNAGTAVIGEIRDLTLDQWRGVIETNLFGQVHAIHAVYPVMIGQGSGHIVNVASGFGMAPGPLNSPYVASKFAIFGLSHALAAEGRAFGVRVSIVCPGYLDTPMVATSQPVNADAAALRAQLPALVPVDKAAAIVLAGVARQKRVIAFPAYVGLLSFLHRFAPVLFDRFADRQVRNFRAIRREPGNA